MGKGVYKHTYTRIIKYSTRKNEEILPFATTYVELAGIMLKEMSHTKKTNSE